MSISFLFFERKFTWLVQGERQEADFRQGGDNPT
jgi:hypothetical protein